MITPYIFGGIGVGGKQDSKRTHNYTKRFRFWGHNFGYRLIKGDDERLDAWGWGEGISEGDYILLTNPANGEETRYQFEKISYHSNPSDMWEATLLYAPRQAEGDV
jgi:hypothetical protein